MYVGLTCKVPSITRRPPRCRCVRQATAVARSLPCRFPPPHVPPTRSMACSSCLCTACRGPITAPVLCHRQRRRRRAKVVARYGSTHTQTCLFPMEVAWFRWAGSAAGLYVRPNAGVFFLALLVAWGDSALSFSTFPLPDGLDDSISHHPPFVAHLISTLRVNCHRLPSRESSGSPLPVPPGYYLSHSTVWTILPRCHTA